MNHLSLKWNLNLVKYLLFSLFLSIGLNSARGQQLDFEKYYFDSLSSGPDLDNYDVIKTSDNGFLMTGVILGWNETYFLMKMNEFGDTLWFRSAAPSGGIIYGQTIKELTNGNYALLCTEFSSYQRLLLLIYDSSGNILSSNHYSANGDLYITNISESNGNLFLLGQEHSRQGTYILKTDLFGDSLSYHVDTTFLIALNNNSISFDGSNFIVAGTTIDTSGTSYPAIVKFDTSGAVLWKVDYLQFSESMGSQLFRYSSGYIFKTTSNTIGPRLIRTDSTGSVIWDIPISQNLSSVLSPDESRILVATDDDYLFWYDSTGAYIQGQLLSLALPGTVVKSFADNQQIFVSGTYRTGLPQIYACAFLVQLTDTSIVSTNDLERNHNNYVYPTICPSGTQIHFHAIDKIPIDMKFSIYSSQGMLMSEGAISNSDPSSEPIIKIPDSIISGLYLLKIFSNNSNFTFRFIVQ